MADTQGYTKQTWVDGETIINAERLGHMEDGIEAANTRAMTPGPKGDPGGTGAAGKDGAPGAKGADGVGVKAIALTKDANGAITGGTWTDTANASHAITITTAGA